MPDTGRCNRYSTVGFTTASRMSQHRSPCFSALNLNILGVCFYCVGPRYNRIITIKMGLKVICWLNDREFKKRGHVSGDLCFSCLCIFPCTWYFLVETKTPPCISICKCIYGICRLDWYPSMLTHRLQVENWWKTRFRMLFFPWL